MNRLTIFGATGQTGRQLVSQALSAGYEVEAFVRDAQKLKNQQGAASELSWVEGDVATGAGVQEAIAGADAVLSVLGHASNSPDDVLETGTRHIVNAMQHENVRRLICLTGAGVPSAADPPYWGAKATRSLMEVMTPGLLKDARNQAEVVRQSELRYTLVRVPRLTNKGLSRDYETGYFKMGLASNVSRADVAHFMLLLMDENLYLCEEPMIRSR